MLGSFQKNADQFFSATPKPIGRIKFFREIFNTQQKKHLIALASEYGRATKINVEEIIKKINTLDAEKSLNPSMGGAIDLIVSAMKSGDALKIENEFKWLLKNDLLGASSLSISPLDTTPAARAFIKEITNNPTQDVYGRHAQIKSTKTEDLAIYQGDIKTAISLLEEADPDMAAEFNELIQSIYLFNGKAIIGGTLSSCLGAMSISLPDLSIPSTATKFGYDAYFLEHFVHELSHNLLNVMMSVDKVVLNSMEESFKAPLRTDLRHMYGVFHAAFVVSRMIRVFRALDAKGYTKFGGLVSHFEPRLQSGLSVIREYGKLSRAGEMVFDSLELTAGLA